MKLFERLFDERKIWHDPHTRDRMTPYGKNVILGGMLFTTLCFAGCVIAGKWVDLHELWWPMVILSGLLALTWCGLGLWFWYGDGEGRA